MKIKNKLLQSVATPKPKPVNSVTKTSSGGKDLPPGYTNQGGGVYTNAKGKERTLSQIKHHSVYRKWNQERKATAAAKPAAPAVKTGGGLKAGAVPKLGQKVSKAQSKAATKSFRKETGYKGPIAKSFKDVKNMSKRAKKSMKRATKKFVPLVGNY